MNNKIGWFSSGILVGFWFLAILSKHRWHTLSYGLAIAGTLVAAIGLADVLSAPIRKKADPKNVIFATAGLLIMSLNIFLAT